MGKGRESVRESVREDLLGLKHLLLTDVASILNMESSCRVVSERGKENPYVNSVS